VWKLFNYEKAVHAQKILGEKVLRQVAEFPRLDLSKVRLTAGFDSSFINNVQIAVAVVYDSAADSVVDEKVTRREALIPYIPGLLAFRELPGYLKTLSHLNVKPDVLLVDGHGLTHPRAFGIATHLGFVTKTPSIGVAKKPLHGVVDEEGYIIAHGQRLGKVLHYGKRRLYVSIGYGLSLESAVEIVEKLLRGDNHLPIPLHYADKLSRKYKKENP
jgi:Deoxyinosine 3'endonuclease (endonuclease V)